MSKTAPKFYVYTRTTGGAYLTPRVSRPGYRWVKNRAQAVSFATRDTARRNANRYCGFVVQA